MKRSALDIWLNHLSPVQAVALIVVTIFLIGAANLSAALLPWIWALVLNVAMVGVYLVWAKRLGH